jgi:hypothetical protein
VSVETIHYLRCDNAGAAGRCERRSQIRMENTTEHDAERDAERDNWLVVQHPDGTATHLCPQHRPSRILSRGLIEPSVTP